MAVTRQTLNTVMAVAFGMIEINDKTPEGVEIELKCRDYADEFGYRLEKRSYPDSNGGRVYWSVNRPQWRGEPSYRYGTLSSIMKMLLKQDPNIELDNP